MECKIDCEGDNAALQSLQTKLKKGEEKGRKNEKQIHILQL